MVDREHPLLMRPELVRATLAGRKTQTRRLVTRANSKARDDTGKASAEDWGRMDWGGASVSADGLALIVPGWGTVMHAPTVWRVTPRVRPGDRLWVREPWRVATGHEGRLDAMSPAAITAEHEPEAVGLPVNYEADGAWIRALRGFEPEPGRWRRGFHMPRWACRLVLPVEAVRVERVQAISEDDARAEGVECCQGGVHHMLMREAFETLWDNINGKRPGASWEADPWVWCYQWRTTCQDQKK